MTTEAYIEFVEGEGSPSGKTRAWNVQVIAGGALIGVVKWYGAWRGYCFFPEPNCVFERKCMRLIGDFCDERTIDQRRKRK